MSSFVDGSVQFSGKFSGRVQFSSVDVDIYALVLRLMLVDIWLGLHWVLFYSFDHYIQSSVDKFAFRSVQFIFVFGTGVNNNNTRFSSVQGAPSTGLRLIIPLSLPGPKVTISSPTTYTFSSVQTQ